MNKEQLIARYKVLVAELKEDPHNVVISAGAALVILGMRKQISMLNADVLPGVFNWLSRSKDIRHRRHIEPYIQLDFEIRVHKGDENTGVVCVDGVWIYSPFELMRQRQRVANFPNRNPLRLARDLVEIEKLKVLMRSPTITARMLTPA